MRERWSFRTVWDRLVPEHPRAGSMEPSDLASPRKLSGKMLTTISRSRKDSQCARVAGRSLSLARYDQMPSCATSCLSSSRSAAAPCSIPRASDRPPRPNAIGAGSPSRSPIAVMERSGENLIDRGVLPQLADACKTSNIVLPNVLFVVAVPVRHRTVGRLAVRRCGFPTRRAPVAIPN